MSSTRDWPSRIAREEACELEYKSVYDASLNEPEEYSLTETQAEERVLAERERCAKIAERYATPRDNGLDPNTALAIAIDIRSGIESREK